MLEWFLSQNADVNGFAHHKWNGVTTLRFAKTIDKIIQLGLYEKLIEQSHTFHFVPGYTLTKYEMLCRFKEVFGKKINVNFVSHQWLSVDRTLSTKFNDLNILKPNSFEEDLVELKCVMAEDFYTFSN